MVKGFVAGFLVGVLLLVGGVYYYFASGMAPAAAGDPPMPFEEKLANKSLNAHINKANVPPPAIPANEETFVAGAKVYKEHCAGCHGLPDQPPPAIANHMYPHATLMFRGRGVTDDPPEESYWKAVNGVRLTGMPSFKNVLTDTQLWQVCQLVAHASEISDSVKKELTPEPAPATQPLAPSPARAVASKQE
ncbi:MAG: cytochrome c [Acidobacteriia bacterium]|nr:cytochrome c [Terriglobia bacterium]